MMNLYAKDLLLRPVSKNDLDTVHQLHALPETDRYNTMGIPADKQETETIMNNWFDEIAQNKKYVFCITGADGVFLGIAGMNIDRPRYAKAEIWYKVLPQYWGRGIATGITRQLLQFGFEQLSLHRVEAGCATENTASARVLEKAGFIKEALCRQLLPIRGEWKDAYSFAILKEDWIKNKQIK